MFSKSLIQLSVDGRGCVLSLLFGLRQTVVGVIVVMVTFKGTCAHQDPGERSSDSCECPGVSSRDMSQRWPATGLGALSAAVCAWDLLKEVTIIFIISSIVWPQVKQQGGNTAPPSTENWIKVLLSMAPPMRTRPRFPLSQSFPSGSFHKTLMLIH